MKFSSNAIPEHIKKLIPSAVRDSMGAAGKTLEEVVAVADDKAERDIQSAIANYLNQREIEYIRPAMHKKSPLPPGWPDFTFSYLPAGRDWGIPVGLEVKTPIGKLSADQVKCHAALRRNGWRIAVVRGVPDVQAIFRELDAL